MIFGTALTDDDITSDGGLASKNFYTESFALRVAAVLYAAFSFLCAMI